jgi:hypothetical protein
MQTPKLILFGMIGTVALGTLAHGQTPARASRDTGSDVMSVAGCSRPEEAREAKVVDLDTGKSLAKLAVNLGAGRFKLVRVTIWDRPDDPRPLIPVIEAARITQGLVQFYTPNLNTDPESAHDSFLLMADMGGGVVCWATPASLIKDAGQAMAEAKPPAMRGPADPAARSLPGAKPESTPPLAPPAAVSQTEIKPDSPPPAEAARRSRTRTQTPAQ